MKKIIAVALAAGIALSATAAADARQGCGRGYHRGPAGYCRANVRPVYRAGPALVVGRFYHGRGYWDGRRYFPHRYRWRGGWRYR